MMSGPSDVVDDAIDDKVDCAGDGCTSVGDDDTFGGRGGAAGDDDCAGTCVPREEEAGGVAEDGDGFDGSATGEEG